MRFLIDAFFRNSARSTVELATGISTSASLEVSLLFRSSSNKRGNLAFITRGIAESTGQNGRKAYQNRGAYPSAAVTDTVNSAELIGECQAPILRIWSCKRESARCWAGHT